MGMLKTFPIDKKKPERIDIWIGKGGSNLLEKVCDSAELAVFFTKAGGAWNMAQTEGVRAPDLSQIVEMLTEAAKTRESHTQCACHAAGIPE